VRSSLKAFLLAIGAVFLFSITGSLAKWAQESLTHWQVIFLRSVVATGLILPAVFSKRPFLGRRRGLLLVRGVFGFIGLGATFYSIGRLALVDAILIFQTAPIFVVPISALYLKEHPNRLEIVLMLLGLLGVALVVKPTRGLAAMPALIGVGGAISTGFVFVLIRELGRTERSSVIVIYFTAAGIIGAAPLSVANLGDVGLVVWAGIVIMGILFTFGNWIMNIAYRLERANRVAMLNFAQVPFATLWGWLFWQEVPDALTLAGAVLIAGSILTLQGISSGSGKPGS
jgi:drug/metabolite transporter (DMT)-like permease